MPKTTVRVHVQVGQEDASYFGKRDGQIFTECIQKTILSGLVQMEIPGTWDVEVSLKKARKGTKRLTPFVLIPPGEVLMEEMKARGLTTEKLAAHIRMPVELLRDVGLGTRDICANLAWRLSRALGTSPEYWMNLQAAHDLDKTKNCALKVRKLPVRR